MLRTESSQVSFYYNHIYDRLIPEDHLLKLLDKVVDFLALESAVTQGSNAVCLCSSLVTPAPQSVRMDMEELGYFSQRQHASHSFTISHIFYRLLFN